MQLQTFTMLTEFSGGTQDIPPLKLYTLPIDRGFQLGLS